MKIKALAPWFGAKRNLAPVVIQEFGEHVRYDEPFCGSCAVLLAKKPCKFEAVNDLNGDLINLARVLKDERSAVELYGRLSRVLFHEDLYRETVDALKANGRPPASEVPDIDRAERMMIHSWFARPGVAGRNETSPGFALRKRAHGGDVGSAWRNAVDAIPAWHRRLQSVTISNRDAMATIERLEDEPRSVIYCDPPYFDCNHRYAFDLSREDHERLAHALGRFRKTRVVLSYYRHPEVERLYAGWTIRDVHATKCLTSPTRDKASGRVAAPECLIINGPSLVEQKGLFA